jgi:hypothetical protein
MKVKIDEEIKKTANLFKLTIYNVVKPVYLWAADEE